MTDVICPFCGAPNPPEAETCKVCNNPLAEPPADDFNLAEGDQPEWLKELRNFNSGESGGDLFGTGSGEKQDADKPNEEVPEWLARVRQKSQEDREQQLANQSEQGQGGESSEDSSPFIPDELPSWLFSDDESKEASEESFSEPGGMDWMSVVRHEQTPPEEGRELPSESTAGPDWQNFGAGSGPISGQAPLDQADSPEKTEFNQPPESSKATADKAFTIELPDYLTDSAGQSQGERKIEPGFSETPEISSGSSEEELYEGSGIEPIEKKKTPRPSLRDQLLKAPEKPPTIEPFKEPDLAQAQLPSWLEAMKPIESVAPAHFEPEADQQIENSGPLAGFQGVLPGGNLPGEYSKPPVYSLKLKVSDKQRVYASLLENLIAEETKAPPEEVAKPVVSGVYVRLFIAVALIGMLIFLSITGIQIGVAPNLFSPEAVAFFDTAKQLSASASTSARVLVAVEYEPGLSAELQTAAVHPLQQLLESGANLALISTISSGPALGEKLVANVVTDTPTINSGLQIINLGFLPGGIASLASLATSPSLAAPTTLSGDPAWTSPILQNINSVADFNGLILLTDNPELARAWVEQVQPSLAGKPFLVISSAQSAPMILPYYNSGQIQGLVAGLGGGAVYDQLSQHSNGVAESYWTAYQAELLLIVLAILAGALFYGVRNLFRKQSSGERS